MGFDVGVRGGCSAFCFDQNLSARGSSAAAGGSRLTCAAVRQLQLYGAFLSSGQIKSNYLGLNARSARRTMFSPGARPTLMHYDRRAPILDYHFRQSTWS
jgi:hypothetical protein